MESLDGIVGRREHQRVLKVIVQQYPAGAVVVGFPHWRQAAPCPQGDLSTLVLAPQPPQGDRRSSACSACARAQ